ncbi:MAG: S41 family peptidase [Acidobacteriota bacterium]|nr:S41 family peptidase [Acidobacteriota bacterium]
MRSRYLVAAGLLALALPIGLAARQAPQTSPASGPASGQASRKGNSQDKVAEQYRVFTTALAAIEQEYVEKLDAERLVYGAIEGMLRTLDPHSSFLDPKSYAQMRERQEGRYYGIGITIVAFNGDIAVTSVFETSPAYRSGIRRGDVIAKIKGQDTKGWTSDQAVAQLKGPKGTTVQFDIRRPGADTLVEFTVERDQVTIPTVRASFMLPNNVGYVRLQDFSETSNDELTAALTKLRAQGMQRVMLDLRDNPGGPLDQAIAVSNQFLPRGDMIVYTRGRTPNADQDFHAEENGSYQTQPLIVLVNRQSASASEIVSGAVQDHDRGLVVGETTFGKALVQSLYRISNQAGLALTTGRYYTPSGRLIQRPWDGSFDEYLTYTQRSQTESRDHDAKELKYTDAGRKVYGGGGIEPDRFFGGPIEGFDPTRFGRMLGSRGLFVGFAEKFKAAGDSRPGSRGEQRQNLERTFTVTDAMLAEFKAYVAAERVRIDEDAFKKDEAFIRAMIRYEIDVDLFGVEQARRSLISQDPQARFAQTLFDEAAKLTQMTRTKASGKSGVSASLR